MSTHAQNTQTNNSSSLQTCSQLCSVAHLLQALQLERPVSQEAAFVCHRSASCLQLQQLAVVAVAVAVGEAVVAAAGGTAPAAERWLVFLLVGAVDQLQPVQH